MWWLGLVTAGGGATVGAVVTAVLERRRDSLRAARKELMAVHAEISNAQRALGVVAAQIEGVNQRVTDVWTAFAAIERSES